jgi:predicted ArsR family transcriptional regulator
MKKKDIMDTLEAIKFLGKSTKEQLGNYVGLAPDTINKHLEILESQRLVSIKRHESKKEGGYPYDIIQVTSEGEKRLQNTARNNSLF